MSIKGARIPGWYIPAAEVDRLLRIPDARLRICDLIVLSHALEEAMASEAVSAPEKDDYQNLYDRIGAIIDEDKTCHSPNRPGPIDLATGRG